MKFILVEEFDNDETSSDVVAEPKEETAEDKVKEIVDSVEVELKEGLEYNQSLLNDAGKLSEELNEFAHELENCAECLEFISRDNFDILLQAIDILEDFHVSYSLYANKKAREFVKKNKGRGI